MTGTLYRNGPAWFDRGDMRYQHWFDGDGMLQAWRFRDGKVTHAARMIATTKFLHEQKAGRFEVRAAGTDHSRTPAPIRNNDDLNTANTAVVQARQPRVRAVGRRIGASRSIPTHWRRAAR